MVKQRKKKLALKCHCHSYSDYKMQYGQSYTHIENCGLPASQVITIRSRGGTFQFQHILYTHRHYLQRVAGSTWCDHSWYPASACSTRHQTSYVTVWSGRLIYYPCPKLVTNKSCLLYLLRKNQSRILENRSEWENNQGCIGWQLNVWSMWSCCHAKAIFLQWYKNFLTTAFSYVYCPKHTKHEKYTTIPYNYNLQ